MAVAAGGVVVVQVAGETANYTPTQPIWCTIAHPASADTRSAYNGHDAPALVQAHLVYGPTWVARRPTGHVPPPTPESLGIHVPPPRIAISIDPDGPQPGPTRPVQYPRMRELLLQRAQDDSCPEGTVTVPPDALEAAQLALGSFCAALPAHRQRGFALWTEARLRAEADRTLNGQPPTDLRHPMAAVCWVGVARYKWWRCRRPFMRLYHQLLH